MINLRKFSRMATLVVLMLTLVSLSGCASVSNPPNSNVGDENKPTLVKLRVGYPGGSLIKELFLQTGIDQGIFAKHGLELDRKDYTVGGQIVQDLAGDNLDLGIVGPSASLAGAAKGVDLKIVSSAVQNYCPLVAGKGITTIKDLNGKKVGTPGVSSIQETMLNYLESQQGIKTTHVYANAGNLVAFLEKGEIDAIVAWEPVAAQAVDKIGAHYLLDTILPGAEAADIAVTGKLFRENPDAVVKFLKAAEETRQYIINHTAERVKVTATLTGLPESVIAEGVRRSNLFGTSLKLNMDSIKLIVTQDIASGKLVGVDQSGLDRFLAKNIDTTLLQKALQ